MPVAGSRQFAEQRLRLFQIGRVEALGEPGVDWRKEVAGLGAVALIAAQPDSNRYRSDRLSQRLQIRQRKDPQFAA